MLFNSIPFAVFLPVVLVIYWLLKRPKWQNLFLVVASAFFYMWWEPAFITLILLSTVTDYVCARMVSNAQKRGEKGRRWLLVSLCLNLGLLGVFKYYDFFIGSATVLWESIGWHPGLLKVILPVGISFYTFQTMAYTVDVYRGDFEARRSFIDVAAYVAFFPQLVAGPIERPSGLFVKLEQPRTLTVQGVKMGLMLMLVGYLKKVVLADGLGPMVDATYGKLAAGEAVEPSHVLLGTYAFVLQIYGDFSGYTDIARGVARLLGIDLVLNFKQPLFSRSHTEMWSRWHISLSGWLRDYLYISLGGNRRGKFRTYVNLMATMVLGGLWHGAAWTYVWWGTLHGVYLVVERLMGIGKSNPKKWSLPKQIVGVFVTFHLWGLALLFFRADTIETAWFALTTLTQPWAGPSQWVLLATVLGAALMLAIDLPHLLHPKEELPAANRKRWMVFTMAIAGLCFYMVPPGEAVSFIYFQF